MYSCTCGADARKGAHYIHCDVRVAEITKAGGSPFPDDVVTLIADAANPAVSKLGEKAGAQLRAALIDLETRARYHRDQYTLSPGIPVLQLPANHPLVHYIGQVVPL